MAHTLSGVISGILCSKYQIIEYPVGARIRLYRSQQEENLEQLTKAQPKHTIGFLQDDPETKAAHLLAEAVVEKDGSYDAVIGDEINYRGAAVDVELYLESVPNMKDGSKSQPVQVHITTINPRWRETNDGVYSRFDYQLSALIWCAIRRRLGAWVILGRVGVCEDGVITQGISGVEVTAYDDDWLHDDTLGTATTNSNGFYRIDYLEIDFKQTVLSPWINIETLGPAGPDLYFEVRDGSNIILNETVPDDVRKDVSACVCVDLCVGGSGIPVIPYFTHYGEVAINNTTGDLDANGRVKNTVGVPAVAEAGDAFFQFVPLKGIVPPTNQTTGKPNQYRFLYAVETGTPDIPVKDDLIIQTKVAPVDGGLKDVYVRASIPAVLPTDDIYVAPDDQGWIDVYQNTANGYGYIFALLRLNTRRIKDKTGTVLPQFAGGNPGGAGRTGGKILLMMEVQDVDGNGGWTSDIHPMYINNWAINSKLELPGNLCAELGGTLNITYTAEHELIEVWNINETSVASTSMSELPISGTSSVIDQTLSINTTPLDPCVYNIHLHGRRKLTNGVIQASGGQLGELNLYIKN